MMRKLALFMVLVPFGCNERVSPAETATAVEQDPQEAQKTQEQVGQQPATRADRADSPADIDAVILAVRDFVGIPVQGTAEVNEVISDRAFWIGSGDQRVLAVVREDVPQHEMIDIDKGQRLKFTGLVLSNTAVDDLTGKLEDDAKQAIREQPAFVAMYWKDVSIMDQ